MFDTGRTTFDIEDPHTNETTFENTYQFTVRVFSADGVVDTYKEFSVTVDADTNKPYETLFARSLAQPPQCDTP